MKALVYTGIESLNYQTVTDPNPKPGEVLVRVESVGICGSDMHAFLGHDERRPAPLILGHEAAGIVQGGPRDGERVTVNPLVSCGICPACQSGRDNLCAARQIISLPPREGAFAQWLAIPETNLVTIPDGVGFDKAALAEPIACGWHAAGEARRLLREQAGPVRALVLGGGAIGLGAALCLAAQGINDVTIIEPNPLRRDFLILTCKQNTMAPEDLTAGQMFDLVIDAVGFAATRKTASAHTRPGGVIAHIGLGEGTGGLDIRRMTLQEIIFIGTYTYTAEDFRDTAAAIFDGRLGALDWTESRPLADGQTAFADIRAGKTASPKIILKPN
tara:strand:+ start:877 stop:1869 length:993 start_codon:yes stop_codon:yes gene_type:complete